MPSLTANNPKEFYNEISALVAGISNAFRIGEAEAIKAIEQNEITFKFEIDTNGKRFVLASFKGETTRLLQDVVKTN